MPRGRRSTLDLEALQQELATNKVRQAQLRQQLRQLRGGSSSVRKLEEKLAKQLATAKWTVLEIHELLPDWDEITFYRSVEAVQPKPRGPRRASIVNSG